MAARSSGAVLPKLFTRRTEHHVHARLDELCDFAPADGTLEERVFWFVRLIAWTRPHKRGGSDGPARVRFLRTHLEASPESRDRVAATLGALVESVDLRIFLAYGGIPRDFHLLGALSQSGHGGSGARITCRTDDLEGILNLALRPGDVRWARASGLLPLLIDLVPSRTFARIEVAARDAMLDLVHQVAAQAHAPNVRQLDTDGRSPFRGLYDAVSALLATPHERGLLNAVRGRIVQCLRALDALRASLSERGADLNTTFQLLRVERQLERLDLLAVGLSEGAARASRVALALANAALRNARPRRLLARSSELVVRNLVDTTADVGDRYLDKASGSFGAALLAGCGGGLLMTVATILKYGIMALHLPLFYEGFAFSANYAAAFCAAYLLHFTIATKLPAHTAAALARSVRGAGSRRERIAAFVQVLRSLVRIQIGGLLGNLVVVGPLAFAISRAVQRWLGHPFIGHAFAEHALHANSALGPSALYAALTGVFLWVSSLVGAAIDNWAKVNHLGAALATGVPVMKTVGVRTAEPAAHAVASRIGGLAGNAFLGLLLGGVPAFLAIAQLPIEIRHVSVSAGSVALAIAEGGFAPGPILMAVVGVCIIGFVNVMVSFALALQLAVRASGMLDRVECSCASDCAVRGGRCAQARATCASPDRTCLSR